MRRGAKSGGAHPPVAEEVYIPQDVNYPAVRLNVDRVHAAELGLSQKDIVHNVITALNSNTMIARNYWVDYKTGNDYFLTVQYYEHGPPAIHNTIGLKSIPLRSPNLSVPTTLDTVVRLENFETANQISHYQIQRVTDVYVTPSGEDLGKMCNEINRILAESKFPSGIRINLRGMVQAMEESFHTFAGGLALAAALLYLILVAQFRSFKDPFLILLAIPMGFVGVLAILVLAHYPQRHVAYGRVDAGRHRGVQQHPDCRICAPPGNAGSTVEEAVIAACRIRLRPILMTSLATIIGMLPMALKLGTGSKQYAPLARAVIGGLMTSVALTVFVVPAGYLLAYWRRSVEEGH